MSPTSQDLEAECTSILNRFFGSYDDEALRKSSFKALRLLVALGEPMSGNTAAWAAGIVYGLSNRYRNAFGIPGLLNQDVEKLFGVTMESIRRRGAQANSRLDELTDF